MGGLGSTKSEHDEVKLVDDDPPKPEITAPTMSFSDLMKQTGEHTAGLWRSLRAYAKEKYDIAVVEDARVASTEKQHDIWSLILIVSVITLVAILALNILSGERKALIQAHDIEIAEWKRKLDIDEYMSKKALMINQEVRNLKLLLAEATDANEALIAASQKEPEPWKTMWPHLNDSLSSPDNYTNTSSILMAIWKDLSRIHANNATDMFEARANFIFTGSITQYPKSSKTHQISNALYNLATQLVPITLVILLSQFYAIAICLVDLMSAVYACDPSGGSLTLSGIIVLWVLVSEFCYLINRTIATATVPPSVTAEPPVVATAPAE